MATLAARVSNLGEGKKYLKAQYLKITKMWNLQGKDKSLGGGQI